MAIAQNRFFNDPALGQAFGNLADIFAPPSGPDLAGYANAGATKEKAARLAEYFALAKDPNTDRGYLDRLGVASGTYTPSTSYYAVDTADATDRRGQDVTRQTTLDTNAADNARALTANTADNKRAFAQTIYGQKVAPGEVTRPVDDYIANEYGMKPLPALEGAPKPLSLEEQKAVERQQLIITRQLTPDMLLDTIVGAETPVKTVGPDGTPRYSTPGAAVRTNAPAYDDTPVGVDNYYTVVNGKQTPFLGYVGQDKRIHNAQDDAVVPNVVGKMTAGGSGLAIEFNEDGTVKSISQGGGKAPTELQTKAGFATEMMAEPTKAILNAFDTGTLPDAKDYAVWQGITSASESGSLPLQALIPAVNSLMSPQGQLFFANMQQALPYELMVRSGQAVNENEYARKLLAMVPLPTDSAEVKAVKRNAFANSQTAITRLAGAAAPANAADPAAAPAAAPAAPAVATDAPDRAESIANAKAALAKNPGARAVIEQRIKAAFPDFNPAELN